MQPHSTRARGYSKGSTPLLPLLPRCLPGQGPLTLRFSFWCQHLLWTPLHREPPPPASVLSSTLRQTGRVVEVSVIKSRIRFLLSFSVYLHVRLPYTHSAPSANRLGASAGAADQPFIQGGNNQAQAPFALGVGTTE